jgi:hypothetical protein
MSRDSVVGIVTSYEKSKFWSRYGQKFSLLQAVQTVSGAHPASSPMSTRSPSPGVKRQEREGDHSPPSVFTQFTFSSGFRVSLLLR